MGGGKGGDSQTVTQRTEIPDFLRPFIEQQAQTGVDALGRLEGQLQGAGAEDVVAGFTPDQQAAMNLTRERAMGAGGFIPTAQQEFLQTAQGRDPTSFLDPIAVDQFRSTAAGEGVGSDSFNQRFQTALRQAQPSIASQFASAGRSGSGLAQTAQTQAAADAFSNLLSQERGRQMQAAGALVGFGQAERGRQMQAAGMLPQMAMADVGLLSNIGAQQQQQAQRELTAPISTQETLMQAAGGGVPLGSLLGSSSTQPMHSSPAAGALGGGLAGLSLGQGLGLGAPAAANASSMLGIPGATEIMAQGSALGGMSAGLPALGIGGALLGGLLG